jgi:serine/threonine-protein kinase ULK/ATG1
LLGDFVAMRPIGSGTFAVVWKAKHVRTAQPVALKIVDRAKMRAVTLENEMASQATMQHPNIVRLLRALPRSPNVQVMAMEFCNHVRSSPTQHTPVKPLISRQTGRAAAHAAPPYDT